MIKVSLKRICTLNQQVPSAPFRSLRSALARGDRQSRKQDFWASNISHKTFTSSASIRDNHYIEMKYNHLNQVIECYDGIGDGTANELEDEIKGYIISNNALWNLKYDITDFGSWKYQDAERKHQPSQLDGWSCGLICCLVKLRLYLKQETGSITEKEAFHFQKVLLVIMLNVISYYY